MKEFTGLKEEGLLKFVIVFCSCKVARVGLVGVELAGGRPKDVANGLFEPVGVGLTACCWLLLAQGLFVLAGTKGSGCCG